MEEVANFAGTIKFTNVVYRIYHDYTLIRKNIKHKNV